jgi:CubicO group peptidase (beta-lactamase class C family)
MWWVRVKKAQALEALSVALLLGACSVGGNATVAPMADDAGRGERSQAVLGLQVDNDEPGCSAAVGEEGKVVWAGARGVADVATGAKLTADTVFDIGSVSKQFTAAAVLLLADAGRLSTEDTVAEHLSGLPKWAGQVTIAQMIHHTSGIPELTTLVESRGHSLSQHVTHAQIVQAVATAPALGFTPGSRFEYSNSNYLLLAEIVRDVSGVPLPRFLQDKIFAPLGLDMRLDPDGTIPGKALSYQLAPDNSGPKVVDFHWAELGPGGIQTTPSELVRWGDNYRTGAVGGERLLRAQLADPVENRLAASALGLGPVGAYGAGVEIAGNGTIVHTGGWEGFRTAFEVSPDRSTVLAVACNSGNEVPAVLAAELRKIWS